MSIPDKPMAQEHQHTMALSGRSVYVGSMYVKKLDRLVAKALEKSSTHDLRVEELQMTKDAAGKTVLSEQAIEKIPEMEYLYTDPHFTGQIFSHPKSCLKWAHLTKAGADQFFVEMKKAKTERKPEFLMTRRDDVFASMMAEYVIGSIVARERNFPLIYDQYKIKYFDRSVLVQYRQLNSLTIGILGLGTIGSEVARYCKSMKMRVIGLVRDERYSTGGEDIHQNAVDEIRPMSQMSSVLESCDYLVNILPSTPHTINLLSGDVLKPCQHKKTVFINIGRGSVIDDDSIVNAVNKGWLGGAILDVFNEEPLPPSSPLWTLPGVLITPHVSGIGTNEMATVSFMDNLKALREGRPLKNLVDFQKGY